MTTSSSNVRSGTLFLELSVGHRLGHVIVLIQPNNILTAGILKAIVILYDLMNQVLTQEPHIELCWVKPERSG